MPAVDWDLLTAAMEELGGLGMEASSPIPDALMISSSRKSSTTYAFCTLIHGNEIGAMPAFRDFIEVIKKNPGSLKHNVLLVLGNIPAAKAGRRFIDRDLNRSFGIQDTSSWETRRAKELQGILKKCTFLVDFHQTIEATQTPFFIFSYSRERINFANGLNHQFPIVTYLGDFSRDGLPLDDYAQTLGVIGVTLELGQIGGDALQRQLALQIMLRTLALDPFAKSSERNLLYTWADILKKENFPGAQLRKGLVNFQDIAAGEILGHYNMGKIIAPKSGYVLFPKYAQHLQNSSELCRIIVRADIGEFPA